MLSSLNIAGIIKQQFVLEANSSGPPLQNSYWAVLIRSNETGILGNAYSWDVLVNLAHTTPLMLLHIAHFLRVSPPFGKGFSHAS